MNPGGIRPSLIYANSPGGEAPGQVTYGEAFTVQPFNNLVVTQSFTGAQIKDVLEQQFVGFGGQTVQRILQLVGGPDLHLQRVGRGRLEGQQHRGQRHADRPGRRPTWSPRTTSWPTAATGSPTWRSAPAGSTRRASTSTPSPRT